MTSPASPFRPPRGQPRSASKASSPRTPSEMSEADTTSTVQPQSPPSEDNIQVQLLHHIRCYHQRFSTRQCHANLLVPSDPSGMARSQQALQCSLHEALSTSRTSSCPSTVMQVVVRVKPMPSAARGEGEPSFL